MIGPGRWLEATRLVCAAAALAVAVEGCAAREAPRLIGPLGTVEALLPSEPVTAFELFELRRRSAVYVIQESLTSPGRIEYELVADGGTGWWRHMLAGRSTALLQCDDDGNIVLLSEDDLLEAVHIEYDPPIKWLPARLSPGRPVVGTSRMTVQRLADGRLRDRGQCDYRVELLGTQAVNTGLGRVEAHIVRTTREIELRMATVKVEIWAAYVPEHGMIAERVRRDLVALGLFESGKERLLTLERTNKPQAPPPPDPRPPGPVDLIAPRDYRDLL